MSLGHFEKFDAEAVLHELRSGGRSNGRVALWGRSMGAATALIGAYIKLSRRVSLIDLRAGADVYGKTGPPRVLRDRGLGLRVAPDAGPRLTG